MAVDILSKENLPYIIGGGIVAASMTVVIMKKLFTSKPKKNYPPNTVILHQCGRGAWVPSLSPFPVKLETYLRMARIPYETDHDQAMSSKGKTPWITYNGVDVADSQLSIEYLNKKLGIDLNAHLSPEERAISRAFLKLTEENLYWGTALQKWVYDSTSLELAKMAPGVNWVVRKYCSNLIKKQTWGHGIGRHTKEEVISIMTADVKALSTFLGTKKFMMGDEPSEVDSAIFGLLAQLRWQMPKTPHEKLLKELTNLREYVDRMKETFWPDWDDCITHGGTRKATK